MIHFCKKVLTALPKLLWAVGIITFISSQASFAQVGFNTVDPII